MSVVDIVTLGRDKRMSRHFDLEMSEASGRYEMFESNSKSVSDGRNKGEKRKSRGRSSGVLLAQTNALKVVI